MYDIIELYKRGYSITKLKKVFKKSRLTIRKILVENGLEIRNISESLSLYYKNNPDSHPWKNSNKFYSKPCEKFKSILRKNNIDIIEEFSPFERNYSIDVALPNYKIGFEINGNQHYEKDGSLKPYYIERSEYMEKEGWVIHQIHYSLCFDETFVMKLYSNSIQNRNIFEFDYNDFIIKKLTKTKKQKRLKKLCSCGINMIHLRSNQCKDCLGKKQRRTTRPTIDQLLRDINEIGFTRTGKKYGVSDNSIRKWIKNLDK